MSDPVRRRHWPAVSRPVRNVLVWGLVVVAATLTGTAGYMILEGWEFFDALYMTVITLATVGFREVHPMDRAGEIWTMLMSVSAVALIFGTVGVAAESIIAEVSSGKREVRRMEKRVNALRGHFIVCGYGRVGSLVARELRDDGREVVVLDVDPASLTRAVEDGFLVVPGDGTSDAVLVKAGVERARGLVAVIDSDANNVYVVISARSLNPDLFIIGRASTAAVMRKVLQAGADRTISPYEMAGRRAVQLALKPAVVDFIDAALSRGDLSFAMEEIEVDSLIAGQTVGDLRARGVFTLAIRHDPGHYVPNPGDDRVLEAGETLIVSGAAAAIRALNEAL
nr:potassium channel protein [Propionibacterium sp.]